MIKIGNMKTSTAFLLVVLVALLASCAKLSTGLPTSLADGGRNFLKLLKHLKTFRPVFPLCYTHICPVLSSAI